MSQQPQISEIEYPGEDHIHRIFFWAVSLLFFLSGAIGLAYEVVWFKLFSQLWGNSTLAMAAVIASFLLGLGLGAFLLGRLADRVPKPLSWYGMCEIGIGLIAFLVPIEIRLISDFYSQLGPYLQDSYWIQSVGKFLLTFIILAPPCILMGGSLPLVLKQFTSTNTPLKKYSGWLYAINTLGAAAGCYFAGFHLLPWFGLNSLNLFLIGFSISVGVVALFLSGSFWLPFKFNTLTSAFENENEFPPAASFNRLSAVPRPHFIYSASLLAGFGSLVLEIVWARQLVLILGGSTYAFTAMLAVFLGGIGLGSMIFHLSLARRFEMENLGPLLALGIIVSSLLGKWSIPILTFSAGGFLNLRGSQLFNGILSLGTSAALELLPTLFMGMLFPLLLHLAGKSSLETGRSVGKVYAFNILGSIAGAIATSLLLIPVIGISGSAAVALFAYTITLALLFPSIQKTRSTIKLSAFCIIAFCSMLLTLKVDDPRYTNLGMYLYGVPSQEMIDESEVLFFEEGPSANVLVTSNGEVTSLRINGKVDASSGRDMATQIGLAYFPWFHLPEARQILVIGYGSGTTSGASGLLPDARVRCCEIEPSVYSASHFFSEVNHKPEENPHFSIIFDDGRSYLQGVNETFDLIISEPSNPWLSGVSNLFTKEFYQLVSEKLTDDGILAQWIQTYAFSIDDYSLIVRTLLGTFPEARLVRISDGDTILLASKSPLHLDEDTVQRAQKIVDSNEAIGSDLEKHFGTRDVRSLLITRLLLDRSGLEDLTTAASSSEINTDLNMRLEFDSPLRLYDQSVSPAEVTEAILTAVDPVWIQELTDQIGANSDQADSIHYLAQLLDPAARPNRFKEIVSIGLRLDPRNSQLLVDQFLVPSQIETSVFEKTLDHLIEKSDSEVSRLSKALWDSGQFERAALVLEKIVERHPQSVTAWTNLAITYQSLGNQVLAEETFQKALELDPFSSFATASYRDFQEELAESSSFASDSSGF